MANVNFELAVPAELNPSGVVIRTAGTTDSPLFCLKDVCEVLGNSNSRQVAERLDPDEKGVHIVDTLGGPQEMVFVTESGLYTIALTSRAENARPFRKWVTGEVLPCIRRHGRYPAPACQGGHAEAFDVQLLPLDAVARHLAGSVLAQVRAELSRCRQSADALDGVPLQDPREWALRFWPEVTGKRLEDIVGRLDQLYRANLQRPAPKDGSSEHARRMFEFRHADLFMRALAYYWRKDHPGEDDAGLFDAAE